MVPPGFPVAVTIAGSGNMRMGDHLGPVKATITSDGDLSLRHASLLQLAIRGSGDATLEAVDGPADIQVDGSGSVKLQRLNGPLQFVQHGSGDLLVSRIDSPAVKIELTGSGDVVLGPGHIVALQARTDGSGDVSAATNIDSADLQASGGGDITLPHVSGTVRKAASDSSTIRINSAGGIGSAALQRLSSLSLADSDDGAEIVRDGQGMNRVSHLLAGMVVLGLLIAVWRTVLRHGGLARLRNHMPRGASPAAPTHPGVVALCDLIANLERRLARVETHVTSREFDLNRKFREIDARSGEMH
jgi:hypothetical protein